MKKVILFATAIAALVGCAKSEVLMEEASPISFSPNALKTKALILPGADTQQDFPTTESFNVFAFADINDGNGVNYVSPLMNDVNISYQGGDWKATTGTYLWPAAGSVDFYAYYPGSLDATFDSANEPKGLNLTGISLGTSVGNQIDPLVGNTLAQMAASKPVVNLVFKHITSQIAVAAYDATNTASLQGKISIEKVVFNNMKTSGDYREGTTAGKGQWSNINTKANFVSFLGSEVLETTESYLSDGGFITSIDNSAAFVVVPEDIVNTGDVQSIDVTYSIAPYSINNFDYPATPSQTVNIPLYGKVTANKFQNGKRYIFHLGISLDGANNEIMFSPKVDGWETVDVDGITIDAVNATLL